MLCVDQPMNVYSEGEEGRKDGDSIADVEDDSKDDEFCPPPDSDSVNDEEENALNSVATVMKEWVIAIPSL